MKSEFRLTKVELERLNTEFQRWHFFLNNGVGLLAFSFALAVQGTVYRNFNAILALIVVFLVANYGRDLFPASFQNLRDKKLRTARENLLLAGITKTKLRLRDALVYWVGFLYLGILATEFAWRPMVKALQTSIARMMAG